MNRQRHIHIFDHIAPVYGLFFHHQVRHYRRLIERYGNDLIRPVHTVLDIGCGTGALAYVLAERGLQVTGIDGSLRMIQLARRNNRKAGSLFVQGDVLDETGQQALGKGCFDLVVASYVLHGLDAAARTALYAFMRLKARQLVVIMDYNQSKGWLTSLVERLEGGDYFNFIRQVQQEMSSHFPVVDVLQTGKRAAWYLCYCDGRTISPDAVYEKKVR